MSDASKKTFLRRLRPGTVFRLLRTGEMYTLVRKEINTPSGTRYVVLRQGSTTESSLHHSCLVSAES